MISLPVSILLGHDWDSGRAFMGVQVTVAIVITFIIKLTRFRWNNVRIDNITKILVASFSLIPFCTSFYIEAIVWLNRRKVFCDDLRRYYIISIAIGILATIGFCVYISIKKSYELKFKWKTFSYIVIVFGYVCLWQQIPISAEYCVDIFETANTSILIGDFLNYGDVPIINHYGGHMMTGVWEGIIYAVLNNDYSGAVFSPYAGYVATIIAVLFFLMVNEVWDEDAALVVALFFPFYNSVSYWGLGILTVLAAMEYVKKNTYFNATLFWFACIWCALYRLDLGFAFLLACFISLLVYIVLEKNLCALKQLIVALVFCAIVGLSAWCGICVIKDINPISRLFEFLNISLSNQSWAYYDIGDMSLSKFAFTYFLMPFASVIALVYIVFSKNIRYEVGLGKWTMIMILGFSYIMNFSRGLVRHSLAENAMIVCIFSGFCFLAMFYAFVRNNAKLFIPAYMVLILMGTLFQTGNNFTEMTVADNAVEHIETYIETWTVNRFAEEEIGSGEITKTYWNQIYDDNKIIERVIWRGDLERFIKDYQVVIDTLLNDDETFVDFINRTSIYPLLNRKNPVYVSQSPLQLSGEYTQERFIEEMEGVPLVLMPFDNENYGFSEGLDGVPNLYRYYKVAEYIYQRYVPLCTVKDKYAIWCLTERYDELKVRVDSLKYSGMDIVSAILDADDITLNSIELGVGADDVLDVNVTGSEPNISELQNVIDIAKFAGSKIIIAVEYETDVVGNMSIFYTTDKYEDFSDNKLVTFTANSKNETAYFEIPITEFTRIKFKMPDSSYVKIKSFIVGEKYCDLIDYGYDGPYLAADKTTYSYLPYIHSYEVNKLPVIWAEGDSKNSVDNEVLSHLYYSEGIYHYDSETLDVGTQGNYLKVHITYDGNDRWGMTDNNDETIDAIIKIGKCDGGEFETKYQYLFTIKEGTNDYIFRISSDYYWYIGEADSVKLECGE